jgi:RNA polymerase sigma factor (sigma-70 family)
MGDGVALLTPPAAAARPDRLELDVVPIPVAGARAEADRARVDGGAGAALSFEDFFRAQYTSLLRAMYLMCGNRQEAEELAQDTFVRAYERWELVRSADNPGGYVYRIGLNLYRSKLRRAARAAKKAIRPAAEPDPFAAADERDAIWRALAELPKGQREAVVMVEWLGMTDDEAGLALGVSPITVRVRIHRARGRLRPLLHPEGENA